MVNKYARKLEEREVNPATGGVWSINDVPATWRSKTRAKVEADGYIFLPDGTATRDSQEDDSDEM